MITQPPVKDKENKDYYRQDIRKIHSIFNRPCSEILKKISAQYEVGKEKEQQKEATESLDDWMLYKDGAAQDEKRMHPKNQG